MARGGKRAETASVIEGILQNLSYLREIAFAFEESQSLIRDRDGRIRFWSRGCQRLYGWNRREAVGRMSHELLKTEFPIPLAEINACVERDGSCKAN